LNRKIALAQRFFVCTARHSPALGHKRAQNVSATVRGPAATALRFDETVQLQQCERFHQRAMLRLSGRNPGPMRETESYAGGY